ncbi:hypothetical protein B0O99DRAFT_664427 [Bisporella sp. PMI_857]|nr:hypothetical protein B0O99DRAFT_664427 [Bisporella sp. PMI_857]
MKLFTGLASSIVFFQMIAAGLVVPSYLQPPFTTPRDLSSAEVQLPKIQVVIEPGLESDISKIVKFCNKNSIDFLVYNRGHGTPKSLASFNGIQISMSNLDKVTIQPDGKSAWLQGGTHAGPVIKYLWDKGYVTTTGACDCVGLAGAGLGGGHGRLEGLYGMISDNFRQLNVVLADGSAIRVNAASHSDLFWAIRGAGHNFGINYLWRGDKLNDVFVALNTLHGNGTTPVNMTANVGNFLMVPAISETEPVIFWQFTFRGTATEAAPYLAPFDAIASVSSNSGDVPYPEIGHAQSVGEDDIACRSTADRIITTAGLQTYNITAEQQIWDSFKKRIAEHPDIAKVAFILHEGFSTQAVEDKDPASSAYPFRADRHLMQFQGNLPPNSGLEGQMLQSPGRLPDAYVNYASGFESVQEQYGHEPWRVARVRGLKAKYDLFNRFRFYNPIL